MPIIYLSPSTQENNIYVTGTGSEEYWMNRLADAMIPYLNSCGIRYKRNTPDMTAGSSIRQANQGWYDFYLALHSNAAAESNYGNVRGIIAFYYPTSTQGQRAAQIFVNNLRGIYPLPDRVNTRPTTSLGEVRDSKFPAVLLESATTTTTRTPAGSRTTSRRSPATLSSASRTTSASPSSGPPTPGRASSTREAAP